MKHLIYLVIFLFFYASLDAQSNRPAHFNIKLDGRANDSIDVYSWDEYFIDNVMRMVPNKYFKIFSDSKGIFSFDLPIKNNWAYFSIFKDGQGQAIDRRQYPVFMEYIAMSGDQVDILLDNFSSSIATFAMGNKSQEGWSFAPVHFSGKDSLKYAIQYKMNTHDFAQEHPELLKKMQNMEKLKDIRGTMFALTDSIFSSKKRFVLANKKYLPELFTEVVLNDLEGFKYVRKADQNRGHADQDRMKKELLSQLDKAYTLSKKPATLLASRGYCTAYYTLFKSLFIGDSIRSGAPYYYMAKKGNSPLTEKMATIYLLTYSNRIDSIQRISAEALQFVKNENYDYILHPLQSLLTAGSSAYDFSLVDTGGRSVRLSDFRGKVVFIDFWYTGCGACKAFYEHGLKVLEESYATDSNVVFISVSVDKTRDLWLNSIYSGEYSNLRAVNLYTGGEGSSHQIVQQYKIAGYPKPLIIDKQGRIVSSSNNECRTVEFAKRLIDKTLSKS